MARIVAAEHVEARKTRSTAYGQPILESVSDLAVFFSQQKIILLAVTYQPSEQTEMKSNGHDKNII